MKIAAIEYWKEKEITIYDKIPDGWFIVEGAMTAPQGYVWICNNKSLFDGTRKNGLLKVRGKNESNK